MKKILITNAMPTNNGDAALIFGLYEKLIGDGYDVSISTMRYETVKNIYPNIKWYNDELSNKYLRNLKNINLYILSFLAKRSKKYREADVIISAAGGYVNSYYGFKEKIHLISKAKRANNGKLIMYSQSVGPLNKNDKKVLDNYINEFDCFMVRDDESYKNVSQYKNILQTNDAAFLLDLIYKDTNIEYKRVAISVREWGHDGRSAEHYKNLIKSLVYKCIDNNFEVEFISTCQGLENYVDDSKIALEIYNEISEKYKKKITVNNKYYNLFQLREYLTKFKFTIGTRLHMCILSLMSNTPALNISYEVKGKECYKILGLPEYSIDYNNNISIAENQLQNFIDDIENLQYIFQNKAELMHIEAVKYYEYIRDNFIKN
ncbi:polysaccharide pyruvyl transferase family protein [Clostridium sp.]|uniref:polysaccharide pyruvyl transferase family protein n=1 Tax=Clostridium sp. TaxID=1506 RepID=UPI0039925437